MTILYLGPLSPIVDWLRRDNDVVLWTDPLTPDQVKGYDWVISYGYRHIIGKDVLNTLPNRFVNLHISYLPWNRGADPNLWSWVDDTPKGVSIHLMDAGLDTGPILAQAMCDFRDPQQETLGTSYEGLQKAMVALFKEAWSFIAPGNVVAKPQTGKGTYHRLADRPMLAKGWDTPVLELRKLL